MNLSADNVLHVEYFGFEKDFMDDGIRCIPMIVRFKLDACGIKLKLKEWNKMNSEERENLAKFPIGSEEGLNAYRSYLVETIERSTNGKPTYISINHADFSWKSTDQIPLQVRERLQELNVEFTIGQWASLSILRRFALLKLTRSSHENRNFPKALKEFGLV